MDDPRSAREAYRAILAQLAEASDASITARALKSGRLFLPGSYHAKFNELISSLDDQQRSMLAELFVDERTSAVFDALALLSWWVECNNVRIAFKGKRLPIGEDGQGMHEAFLDFRPPFELPADDA
jgi:hypothetical protein